MKNKSVFVVTKDKETANKLISEGLRLVTEINGTYTFENKPLDKMVFGQLDKKKMAYTNILSL